MKLQTILLSLLLTFVVLASAPVIYSSLAAASRHTNPSEQNSERVELASMGFQVGQMKA